MKRKGNVLIQVLMTAVVVAVIAAGLMQMMLMRATLIARASEGASARKADESAFNSIMTAWNLARSRCVAVPGWAMTTGSAGSCNCSYTRGATVACAGTGCSPAAATNPCTLQMTNTPTSP